jgi:hypothetical protein
LLALAPKSGRSAFGAVYEGRGANIFFQLGPPFNSLLPLDRSAPTLGELRYCQCDSRKTNAGVRFRRQEFILLSDILGLSALVDTLNHPKPEGATEATVLGPFFTEDAHDVSLNQAFVEPCSVAQSPFLDFTLTSHLRSVTSTDPRWRFHRK